MTTAFCGIFAAVLLLLAMLFSWSYHDEVDLQKEARRAGLVASNSEPGATYLHTALLCAAAGFCAALIFVARLATGV